MKQDHFQDTYEIRLWIRGESLDPQAVTELLELEPSTASRKGEPLPNREWKLANTGSWSFNEKGDEEWTCLEEGLVSMIQVLSDRRELLLKLAKAYDVMLFCALYKESFEGGPTFSAQLLTQLAALGIPLHLSCYCGEPKE